MKCSLLTLSGYIDSELDARQTGEVEAHLVGCARCRAGIGQLREEVERVGGLAAVHVPDDSVRSLLEMLGLIDPGDPLPAPPLGVFPSPASSSAPPWLASASGPALPWSAPPRAPREPSPGPPSVGEPTPGAPPSLLLPDLESGQPSSPEAPGSPVPAAEPALEGETAGPALPDEEPTPLASLPLLAAVAAGRATPPLRPADPDAAGGAGSREASLADPSRRDRIVSELVGTLSTPSTPRPSPPGDTPVAVRLPHPVDSLYPLDDEPIAVHAEPAPAEPAATPAPTSDGADAWAPVGLDDPDDDRAGGPVAAGRPRLIDRFRDRMAMRRALASGAADDLDGIEVVSGLATAPRPPLPGGELARRREEALRPSVPLDVPLPTRRREPGVQELLPPSARPSRAVPGVPVPSHFPVPIDPVPAAPPAGGQPIGVPAAPPAAGGQYIGEEERAPAPGAHSAAIEPDLAALRRLAVPAPPPPAPPRRRPSTLDLREGRRLLVLYVAAVATLLVVGLLSARTTTPIPAAPTGAATSASSSATTGASAPAVAAAPTAAAPSAPAPSAPAPSAPPSAAPAAPVGGGSGFTVSAIRSGDHGTFYRVVIELSGGSGMPTASVTNQDAQTLVVTIGGTAAGPGSTPPAGSVVRTIEPVSPSPTSGAATYRIALAKAATGHLTTLSGPVRIVIDIS